jgi:hypothetical protein
VKEYSFCEKELELAKHGLEIIKPQVLIDQSIRKVIKVSIVNTRGLI